MRSVATPRRDYVEYRVAIKNKAGPMRGKIKPAGGCGGSRAAERRDLPGLKIEHSQHAEAKVDFLSGPMPKSVILGGAFATQPHGGFRASGRRGLGREPPLGARTARITRESTRRAAKALRSHDGSTGLARTSDPRRLLADATHFALAPRSHRCVTST